MDVRHATFVLTALAIFSTPAIPQAELPKKDDPWLLLNKITHNRTYTIETRDGKCMWGTIKSVTSDRLTASVYPEGSYQPAIYRPAMRTFNRNEVLHVGVGWVSVLYYSGRSSWADVAALRARGRQRLRIVAKSGKTYELKQPYIISDDSNAAMVSGTQMSVPKKDIARIYAILEKPVTDEQEYLLGELGPFIIFDPYFYEYGFHLERYVPVLLYDASQPEDNSPTACEVKWQRLRKKQLPLSTPEVPATPATSPLP